MDGATPLLAAAKLGHAGICALLLDAGADPDTPDAMGACGRDLIGLMLKSRSINAIEKEQLRLRFDMRQQLSEEGPKSSTPGGDDGAI